MIELFERGGIMMYPLALSSLIALSIIFERGLFLSRRKILRKEIINLVQNFSGSGEMEHTLTTCSQYDGPLSAMIQLGLRHHHLPQEEMRTLLEEQGRQEIRVLERGLSILETIASIAPLMGLLGTVLGMIQVFDVIKTQGIGQTAALSGGISQALITTVAGLFIGIPVLIAFNFFTSKAESLILDIEKYTNTLVYKLHNGGRLNETGR